MLVSLVVVESTIFTSTINKVYAIDKYYNISFILPTRPTSAYCETLDRILSMNCTDQILQVCNRIRSLLISHKNTYCTKRQKRMVFMTLLSYMISSYVVSSTISVRVEEINKVNNLIAKSLNDITNDLGNINFENQVSNVIDHYVSQINEFDKMMTDIRFNPQMWKIHIPSIRNLIDDKLSDEVKNGSTILSEHVGITEETLTQLTLKFIIPIKKANLQVYEMREYVHLPKIRDLNQTLIQPSQLNYYIGREVLYERSIPKAFLIWQLDNSSFHIVNTKTDIIFTSNNDFIWFATPLIFMNINNAPQRYLSMISGEMQYNKAVHSDTDYISYVYINGYICLYSSPSNMLSLNYQAARIYRTEKCIDVTLNDIIIVERANKSSFVIQPEVVSMIDRISFEFKFHTEPYEIVSQVTYSQVTLPPITKVEMGTFFQMIKDFITSRFLLWLTPTVIIILVIVVIIIILAKLGFFSYLWRLLICVAKTQPTPV
jgi:hypothetical protein